MLGFTKSKLLLCFIRLGSGSNINSVCFCSTSMQAFSLAQDVGGSGESCAAQCLQNPAIACSGVLAIEVTSLVPLLPLPGAGP